MKYEAKKLLSYLISIHIEQPEYLEDMFESVNLEELNEEQRKELFQEVDNICYKELLPRLS